MKSLHEPVVALAGLEQEWPGTGLAEMGLVKYEKNVEKCKYLSKYAHKIRNHMLKYAIYMHLYVKICR